MSKLRGVIFDLDGTLGDTTPICVGAFQRATELLTGRWPTDEEVVATWGPSEEGSAEVLAPGHGAECMEAYIEWYERLHDSCEAPFAGVSQMLDRLSALGVRFAIVTGKGGRSCEISMRRMGLNGRFDFVEVGCPDRPCKPDKVRLVMDRWGFAPESVIYVGDAPSDVDSARKAGIAAIGAAWAPSVQMDRLRAKGPDELFTDVDSFTDWAVARAS